MHTIIMVEFILYLVIMLIVGYLVSRRSKGHADFLLGGKQLPGWALAFSERATGESAWLLLGYTGFVFATGLSGVWVAVGIASGIIFAWLFLAKRFMEEAEKTGALTLPGYLAYRFGNHGKIILWLSTILIFSFMMFYFGAQIAGAGKTLLAVFNIPTQVGAVLSVVVVIILAYIGGFVTVVWTDMIQAIMMLVTLVVLPIVALVHILAADLSISAALVAAGPSMDSWTGGAIGFSLGLLLFNNFAWFFGFLGGQPQLSARFMALRSKKETNQGGFVAITWTILAYGGAFMIGITALTLYQGQVFDDVEMILPFMILDLMPPWIAGILLAGILAAIISTADSQLLVITSSVSEDIIRHAMNMNLSEKKLVAISRLAIVGAGIVGLIIALTSKSLVFLVVSWAWAGVGCTLSPAVILTFFWKRYSGIGVIATIISGFVSTVIWISTPLDAIATSRFTTFFIAAAFGIVFSLLFPDKKDEELKDEELKYEELKEENKTSVPLEVN
ncbi:sodium/proline symporter [Sporosarcina sp. Marseille-Q4063]|uniref:sodium/proline symporter n=1 Tax=Sporosarcina sp. Marseille-Q4063 TaxID=2810514 RepID=UPI001BAE6EC3|nr:sodium/proline symporter [Sporosarcina sp. Marseille-Q4063]QUW22205.1 sodium/proline symporter [Sporosarcina sp. Marseille-Q4063]